MKLSEVLEYLHAHANFAGLSQLVHFGIVIDTAFGVKTPLLRSLAKTIGKNHELAVQLWQTNIHEARILAGMIDDPNNVTEAQMEQWVSDFNSWDVCDQVCLNLFDKVPGAYDKAKKWAKRDEEFVKRAGFVLMACLAVHDKKAANEQFSTFFPYIKQESTDERNFVKKAVNWALRQIGKRNLVLNQEAIKLAQEIKVIDSKTARWIANDALRELSKPKSYVQQRLLRA